MADIFDNVDTPVVDEHKDYLNEYVGEGKKYKTPQDLAKSKAHADAHIDTLTRTLNEMREELGKRKTSEELINQIASMRAGGDGTVQATTPVEDQTPKGLTAEDVQRMFNERDANARQNSNLTNTIQTLKDRFGSEVQNEITKKANSLGVTNAELRDMAMKQPQVFLALFPQEAPLARDVFGAPVSPARNTASVPSVPGDKFSEYQKVKKDNPSLYWSASFQRKMTEAGERAMNQGRYDQWKNS